MDINLHIDQLVLHGFDRIDQRQIGSVVQSELSRLIREQGLPPSLNQDRTIGILDVGEYKIGKSAGFKSVGTQVAQKVYRGIER